MLYVALRQFIRTATDNNHNRYHFGRCKNILYSRTQIYTVTIHTQNTHCGVGLNEKKKNIAI